jgi:hypothetical protein
MGGHQSWSGCYGPKKSNSDRPAHSPSLHLLSCPYSFYFVSNYSPDTLLSKQGIKNISKRICKDCIMNPVRLLYWKSSICFWYCRITGDSSTGWIILVLLRIAITSESSLILYLCVTTQQPFKLSFTSTVCNGFIDFSGILLHVSAHGKPESGKYTLITYSQTIELHSAWVHTSQYYNYC